jgi:hypothetical protein
LALTFSVFLTPTLTDLVNLADRRCLFESHAENIFLDLKVEDAKAERFDLSWKI